MYENTHLVIYAYIGKNNKYKTIKNSKYWEFIGILLHVYHNVKYSNVTLKMNLDVLYKDSTFHITVL